MKRGPMALFGAIIAVGLGPAMWLGAQFGQATGPTAPPVIGVESDRGNAPGRAGSAVDEAGLESANRSVDNRIDRRRVAPNPTSAVPVLPSSRPPRTGASAFPVDSSAPPSSPSTPTGSPTSPAPAQPAPSTEPSVEPDDPVTSPDTPDTPDDSPVAAPSGDAVI